MEEEQAQGCEHAGVEVGEDEIQQRPVGGGSGTLADQMMEMFVRLAI